jgi:5'-nucleotidase
MASNGFDLTGARVLVSNDDGINAPGLKILERVAHAVAREVWVVAPETEQSAVGHSLTRRRPLRIREVAERRFAVDGTPTDSVLLAVRQIMADHPPDIVFSGVNHGGNLCDDVTYSGTVAAAMEGSLLGVPSVAFSLVTDGASVIHWESAEKWAPEVLGRLCAVGWPAAVVMNINFPNLPARAVTGIEATSQGGGKTGQGMTAASDPHGEAIYWLGTEAHGQRIRVGEDVDAVHRGAISVTPLSLDLTDRSTLAALKASLR